MNLDLLGTNHQTTKQSRYSLGIVSLAALGVGLGSIALNLFSLFLIFGLVAKKPPALVQLSTGDVVEVKAMENNDRSPPVITKFVTNTLQSLMTWTGKIPVPPTTSGQEGGFQPDPGVDLQVSRGNRKITTLAWQASFGLSEDFRAELLRTIATMTPQEIFTPNSGTQVVLLIQHASPPEKIQEGRWRLNVIANVVMFDPRHPEGASSTPFNKEILVQAIDVVSSPLPTTPIEAAIYRIRQSGLQIYQMRDLSPNFSNK